MQNSNLLSLLRRLEKGEWKSFGKFLQSPYHNSNKRLPAFYGYLRGCHPAFGHPKLERQKTWQAMFGKAAPFDGAVLRVLMASMHKAAEQFLIVEQLHNNKTLQSRLLAASFDHHQLYPRFVQTTKTALKNIDDQPIKRMEDLLDAFLLNVNLHFHPETSGLTSEDQALREAFWRLDVFYAFAKLRLSSELSARVSLLKETAEFPLLQPLREHAEGALVIHEPAIRIYLDLLEINFEGLTEERFFNLKNAFFELRERLDKKVQLEVLIYLVNFGNKLATNNNPLFFRELFELNRVGVGQRLFLVNGVFPDAWFINASVVGAICKEWTWTEDFIKQESPHLRPDIAGDATSLAKAFLLFHQGMFDRAYVILDSVPDNDMGYQLRRKALVLRCLFEMVLQRTDFIELLQSHLAAFEKFLSRQRVFSKDRVLADLNFCKVLGKMLPLLNNPPNFKEHLSQVHLMLEAKTPLAARGWFLEKIRDMEKQQAGG